MATNFKIILKSINKQFLCIKKKNFPNLQNGSRTSKRPINFVIRKMKVRRAEEVAQRKKRRQRNA